MITARVDTGSAEIFVRNQVRVVASYQDGRQQVIIGRGPGDSGEYTYIVDGSDLPEGVSLFVLDTRRDVAHAVYLALKEHFEPKDPIPLASDRAYADARTDIDRQHALINKLVDAVTQPPTTILSEMISGPPESPR